MNFKDNTFIFKVHNRTTNRLGGDNFPNFAWGLHNKYFNSSPLEQKGRNRVTLMYLIRAAKLLRS